MALARSTARRYAEAAFEIAERDDSMEVWLAAFAVAEERLTGPDVMRLLSNPSIPVASRVLALEKITGSDVVGPQRNLLTLMVRRGRFELLPGVIREFARQYRLREGIVQATVTSATELKATEVEALRRSSSTRPAARSSCARRSMPTSLVDSRSASATSSSTAPSAGALNGSAPN